MKITRSSFPHVLDRIRTHDLLVRSQSLYPAELHAHIADNACNIYYHNRCRNKSQVKI